MRGAEAAAAGGGEADGAAGEETDQAFDVDIVLKRDMVVRKYTKQKRTEAL